MYMLLIEGKIKRGKKEEFLKVWNSQILPLLKSQSGFVDEVLLFEQGNEAPTGLSFWKTREEAERYRDNNFSKAKSSVSHLIESPPTIRGFDVAAAEIFRITAGKAA